MRGFNTLRFEADPFGGGLPSGPGVSPVDPDGPGPGPVEPEPAPEQAPDIAAQMAEMQQIVEQQQQMLQQLQPMAEYLGSAPQPQIDGQTYPQIPDPFSENYAAEMQQFLDARDQQRLAPYEEIFHERRMEELNGRAMDMIHDVQQRNGELLSPQYEEGMDGLKPDKLILEIAKDYSPQMVGQYGEGVRADEAAIEAAYNDVKTLFEGIAAAHDARAQNQLSALSSAPREPGSSGIAAQTAVTTQPGGWEAFKARQGLTGA